MTGPAGAEYPLVTAIIPAFNAERFVVDAVSSVLAQSYPSLECVVVNDGSTDRTSELVRSFGPKVRLVEQPNRGVASARNQGIAEAAGDLVAFLDADDIWAPDKIARQVEVQLTTGAALIYTGLTFVDEDLTPLHDLQAPPPLEAIRNSLLLQARSISVAQTALVTRAAIEGIGGFDETLSTSADTDVALRIATRWPVERVADPLALYRQHPNQMHHDIAAMERDMKLVYHRLFSDPATPPEILRLRSRAYAELDATVAAARWAQGDRLRSFVRALRAASRSPSAVIAKVTAR